MAYNRILREWTTEDGRELVVLDMRDIFKNNFTVEVEVTGGDFVMIHCSQSLNDCIGFAERYIERGKTNVY